VGISLFGGLLSVSSVALIAPGGALLLTAS
jgi:hypothetical protein